MSDRPIKFRAWDKNRKEYLYFDGHLPQLVGFEIEFSTGLKDKDGKKEVFRRDEIYFSISETQHYKGYVDWSEKGLCYVVRCYWQKHDEIPHICDGYELKFTYENTCVMRLSSECSDIEIIGNRHQHKELLEANHER